MTIEKPEVAISANSFLQALRKQTAPLHEQLEQLPISAQLTDERLCLSSYILYLQKMYHVNLYMEKNIFPLVQEIIHDIPDRRKLQLVTNDLAYLDTQINTHDAFCLEVEPDIAFALGVMYVMEGSVLGGRIIVKNVERALQLTPESGASYFAGYKANTGPMWKFFLAALEGYCLHSNCGQSIIAGAVTAFTGIIHYMQQQSN